MLTIPDFPSRVETIPFALVDRDEEQPRQDFDDDYIASLAKSIRENGLINPIYVRNHPDAPGRFRIVAGECRIRALSEIIGLTEFRLNVLDDNAEHYVISLMENEVRKDLNPIERAQSYRTCMEKYGYSVAQVAAKIGKSEGEIYRFLRYLKLSPQVQDMVRKGQLTQGNMTALRQYRGQASEIEFAKALARGEDPAELIETQATVSERSESGILARLPTTPEGLIKKMLRCHRDIVVLPLVADRFLELPKEEQVKGWEGFTTKTREHFVLTLGKLIGTLQALEQQMATLPRTKKTKLEGAAGMNRKAMEEGRELLFKPPKTKRLPPPPPPPPPEPPAPVIVTFAIEPNRLALGAKARIRWEVQNAHSVSIDHGIGKVQPKGNDVITITREATYTITATGLGGKTTGTTSVEIIEVPKAPTREPLNFNGYKPLAVDNRFSIRYTGRAMSERSTMILGCLFGNAERRRPVNLSKEHLRGLLGVSVLAEAEEMALKAIHLAEASWLMSSKELQNGPQKAFLEKIEKIRKAFGASFPEALGAAWTQDESVDPVDFRLLIRTSAQH